MSAGKKDDLQATQNLIRLIRQSNGDTWLRHVANTQAATIDMMILEGKYTIEEIAMELNARENTKQPLKKRIIRVADHIAHLQEGNARGRWSGMEPHNLKIKKDSQGRLSFDV